MRIAVTVHGQIVHDIDVYDVVPEIVGNSLRCRSHRLKKSVLVVHMSPQFPDFMRDSGCMDIGLSVCRSHSDGLVLDDTSEAGHCMSLEMCKVDHEVIILHVRPDNVILDMCGVPHRNVEFSLGIHYVHICNVKEPVFAGSLDVVLSI